MFSHSIDIEPQTSPESSVHLRRVRRPTLAWHCLQLAMLTGLAGLASACTSRCVGNAVKVGDHCVRSQASAAGNGADVEGVDVDSEVTGSTADAAGTAARSPASRVGPGTPGTQAAAGTGGAQVTTPFRTRAKQFHVC
jgi:hypothetical protein